MYKFSLIHQPLLKIVFGLMSLAVLLTGSPVYAQDSFSANQIFKNTDIYSLPKNFSSPAQIQLFLESKGSVLAQTQVRVGLYGGGECAQTSVGQVCYTPDPINNPQVFSNKPAHLNPYLNVGAYNNQNMSVADFIWKLSREDFGSGCDLGYPELCFQNSLKPINPGFVLAMIQKESRLVYGACAKPDADTNPACSYSSPNSIQKLGFRMERAVGYFCFETSNKAQSCWDENPRWRTYKGFFRQVYHMVRRVRLLEQMCIAGGGYSFKNSSGDYKVGSTVVIDGTPVQLLNGITCALYVYTPHFSGNNLHWAVMKDIGGLYDFRDEYGLDENYYPKPIK